jgi:hypothetical protein
VPGAGQLAAGGRAPAPPWLGGFLDGSLGRGRSGHKQVFQAFQSCQGGALLSLVGTQLLCRNRKAMHIAPPPICLGICEAYLPQDVRFSKGLIETVEPSSCPAAIGWDCCA